MSYCRFDFVAEKRAWIYRRSGKILHAVLDEEIGRGILDVDSNLVETCYLGGKGQ